MVPLVVALVVTVLVGVLKLHSLKVPSCDASIAKLSASIACVQFPWTTLIRSDAAHPNTWLLTSPRLTASTTCPRPCTVWSHVTVALSDTCNSCFPASISTLQPIFVVFPVHVYNRSDNFTPIGPQSAPLFCATKVSTPTVSQTSWPATGLVVTLVVADVDTDVVIELVSLVVAELDAVVVGVVVVVDDGVDVTVEVAVLDCVDVPVVVVVEVCVLVAVVDAVELGDVVGVVVVVELGVEVKEDVPDVVCVVVGVVVVVDDGVEVAVDEAVVDTDVVGLVMRHPWNVPSK